jgi:large subunit ribosomal protein L6
MKQDIVEEIEIPAGVHVSLSQGVFHVKGAKGEVSKSLHIPRVQAKVEGNQITFSSGNATQREKRMIMTFEAHLKSLFKGVSLGHVYKLKLCSSHFPMTAAIKGDVFEVKNYFGEQVSRFTKMPKGVSVKVDGQNITVEGVNKELVSQAAAQIEQSTKRPGFDKRIFQDGIYMIEKDGKVLKDL